MTTHREELKQQVDVLPCDREAWIEYEDWDGAFADKVRTGSEDNTHGLQLFARHRQAFALSERNAESWRDIETAPEVKGKYFYCRLAWGPDDDKCTGDGFRWNGRWFVAANFYKNAPFDQCQNEIRQTEVQPTHWRPLPEPPATAIRSNQDAE